MIIRSKALEVNLADFHVEVDVHPRFAILEEVMAVFSGMQDEYRSFLEELSHPYKNHAYIVKKARRFALEYFYLLKNHPRGQEGALLYVDMFLDAVQIAPQANVKTDAADNLLLFILKIIKEAKGELNTFSGILDETFQRIECLDDALFDYFVKSYYSLVQVGEALVGAEGLSGGVWESLNRLIIRYLNCTYRYFLGIRDPLVWFADHTDESPDSPGARDIFRWISADDLERMRQDIQAAEVNEKADSPGLTEKLVAFPGFTALVKQYRNVPRKLYEKGADSNSSQRLKLLFLFHIMGINGLSLIHEDVLREINRTMKVIIEAEQRTYVLSLMDQAFPILKRWVNRYPDAALNCVFSMGEGIYRTDDVDFVNFFIDHVIDLGFQAPRPEGEKDDDAARTHLNHLLSIRIWMSIIQLNPKWSSRLMSALIIHLTLCGMMVKDTDLFPRDITRFLSSRIEPVYNLCKQLARMFPSYFNEIGAEGQLRDISTDLDEMCQRKDRLVHYIRKQSHVESSNRLPRLMEKLFEYWKDGDKTHLENWIPEPLYKSLGPSEPYFSGVHSVVCDLLHILPDTHARVTDAPQDLLKSCMKKVRSGTEEDRRRVLMAHELYILLYRKYNPGESDLPDYIAGLEANGFPGIDSLADILGEKETKSRLYKLLGYLEYLKKLILADKEYAIQEDVYHKRHITVDIPSMYGSYHETRFNAMGLCFRLERQVNVLFEEYIRDIDLSLITKATFFQIYNRLLLFDTALKIDGIYSREFEKQLNLMIFALGSSSFTYTQYLDIIKGFVQAVQNIVNVYINTIYKLNLDKILMQIDPSRMLHKFSPLVGEDAEKFRYRVSEVFFREKISQALGLQQLDQFLSRILKTLYNQSDILPERDLMLLLNYDPQRAMARINKDESLALGIVVLGNKGLNLCRLTSFGWPIPPGFIITTEVYRCRNVIRNLANADKHFNTQLKNHIADLESATGKRLGDPGNPMFLSVRSGSSISQPGMMDSLLNVGMNPDITEALARHTGNLWFAWDNYRRFLQCYGMAFHLERDDFDLIINDFKREAGVLVKRELSGGQMKTLALKYRAFIQESGVNVEDDPFEQLKICIRHVLDSWDLPKARAYRMIMGISHDWGTAVTVQNMVFGNMTEHSGSGVMFTHNPRLPGDTLKLWGDFTIGNQGEDVAAGLVNTLPVSQAQIAIEQRNTEISLETHFPDIFNKLKLLASELIRTRAWTPQEIEFTFESPDPKDLYILQTRDMVLGMTRKQPMFDLENPEFKTNYLSHGIGVSGGAMSGRIVYSLEDIEHWRRDEPETPLILLRNDTVPDDIKEIHAADGLLTARGGITSHASVVAHRLEKTCVVGCSELYCDEKNKTCKLGDLILRQGDYVSINGQEGSIYKGFFSIKG